MIILQYHEIFFRLTAPRCHSMAAGAVSLRKSHDIVILSFCNIVKDQAKCTSFVLLNKKKAPYRTDVADDFNLIQERLVFRSL